VSASSLKIIASAFVTLLVALFVFWQGELSSNQNVVYVEMPSVSRNLDLNSSLTYAATAILNDTSAHLIIVTEDLTLEGQVVNDFETKDGGKSYKITLKSDYRTSRGELVNAHDVAYTVRYYLSRKNGIAGVLKSIVGADLCRSLTCELAGFKVTGTNSFEILLREPDAKFMEKLASPWLIIFKQDRPFLEKIGDCTIPYQTGRAEVVKCDQAGVHVRINNRNVILTEPNRIPKGVKVSRLLTDNPGDTVSPTLTVFSAYAIPHSKLLTQNQRVQIMSSIRKFAPSYAETVKLNWSPLMTSKWLGVEAPSDLVAIDVKQYTCPNRAIRILLDTSFPSLTKTKAFLTSTIKCPIEFEITNADKFFSYFNWADIALVWFCPDFLDIYNTFASLDCSDNSDCYFNWHDRELQNEISRLKDESRRGIQNKEIAVGIEKILLKKGYVAPLAELNWWIDSPTGIRQIHAAGLFQIRLGDFL